MNWRDSTSYSRGDKERAPNSWEFVAAGIRVCVHKHIHYPKDQWLLSCEPFFNKREMPHKDIEECKKTALELVIAKLRDAADSFSDGMAK